MMLMRVYYVVNSMDIVKAVKDIVQPDADIVVLLWQKSERLDLILADVALPDLKLFSTFATCYGGIFHDCRNLTLVDSPNAWNYEQSLLSVIRQFDEGIENGNIKRNHHR